MKASIYLSAPSGEAIAEAHNGRRISDGRYGPRWAIHCPVHDDKNASAVLFVGDDGGLGAYCYASCDPSAVRDALGLTRPRSEHGTRSVSIRQLEREGIKHMVAGTLPARWPPYTRELPRTGRVCILIAAAEWPRRPVPALLLPPGHPPGAYRWPVAHRPVDLIDLNDNPPPGYFHYGRLPWLADPWQWREVRRRFLRAFAYLLLSDYGAASVRVVGSADRVVYEGRRTNAA